MCFHIPLTVVLTVNPSTYVELPIFCILEWPSGFHFVISLSVFVSFGEVKCNKDVVQSTAALNTVLVKKIMWYFSFIFPSMNHPQLGHLESKVLQVFTVVKKHNVV